MTECDHRWNAQARCERCGRYSEEVMGCDLPASVDTELVRLSERLRAAEERAERCWRDAQASFTEQQRGATYALQAIAAAEARGAARQREADIVWIRDEWNSYDSDDASAAWRIASDLAVEPLVTAKPEETP